LSGETIHRTFRIENEMGLHARPAAMLVQALSNLDCEVAITRDDTEVDGKSIMGVMMLAAEFGSDIEVRATGPQAQKAMEEIERLVREKFSE
jgi:phosphocarrier protein HPr